MENNKVQVSKNLDIRGELIAIDNLEEVPFKIKRLFIIQKYNVRETRGNHAHMKCKQFLIVLEGSVEIVLHNGTGQKIYNLNAERNKLYVPPMHWLIQKNPSDNLQLLILASDKYDKLDYISQFENFLKIAND